MNIYKYKDNYYEIINATAALKHPVSRNWVSAVAYRSIDDPSSFYIRMASEFYDRFVPLERVDGNKKNTATHVAKWIEANQKLLWKKNSRYQRDPSSWSTHVTEKGELYVNVMVKAQANVKKPTRKTLTQYIVILYRMAEAIKAITTGAPEFTIYLRMRIEGEDVATSWMTLSFRGQGPILIDP